MRGFNAVLTLAILGLSGSSVLSHEHATGIVKERMDLMEGIGKRMKAITGRIKNKRDLSAVKADASAIAASAAHIAHMFPRGSTQPPTEARATIWQNWPDFERMARALEIE